MKPHAEHFKQKKTLVKMAPLGNSLGGKKTRKKAVAARLAHSERRCAKV